MLQTQRALPTACHQNTSDHFYENVPNRGIHRRGLVATEGERQRERHKLTSNRYQGLGNVVIKIV